MKWILFIASILSLTTVEAQKKVVLDSATAQFFLGRHAKATELEDKVRNGEARENELLGVIKNQKLQISSHGRDSSSMAETAAALRKKTNLSLDSANTVVDHYRFQVKEWKATSGGLGLLVIVLVILLL